MIVIQGLSCHHHWDFLLTMKLLQDQQATVSALASLPLGLGLGLLLQHFQGSGVACSAWQPLHEDSLPPPHASSGSTQVEHSHRLYRTSYSTWHQTTYSRHRSGATELTIVLALRVTWTTQTAFRQIRAYLDWSYCIVYSWCCHRKVQASPNQQRTNRLFSGWVYFTVLIP